MKLPKLRVEALRALKLNPFGRFELQRACGDASITKLPKLRVAALRAHGVDPFDVVKLARIAGVAIHAAPKAPRAKRVGGRPAAPRVPRASKVQKVFADFLASRCKSLALAAKVLGITPRPPLVKATVRAAWLGLIRTHHPDKGGSIDAAQAINAAYQLLVKFSQ